MSGGWLGPSDEEELEDLRAEQADARYKREREERYIQEAEAKPDPNVYDPNVDYFEKLVDLGIPITGTSTGFTLGRD